MRKELGEHLDDLNRQLDGKSADSQGSSSSRQAPSDRELTEKLEEARQKVADRFGDADTATQREALERQLETFEKLKNEIPNQSAPIDQLSPEAQRALEEEFKKLPTAEKRKLSEKAQELLEDLEDKIRESMEAQLEQGKPDSHGDRRRQAESAKRAAMASERIDQDIKEMERKRQDSLGEWDWLREVTSAQVTRLHSRLERLFRPTVPEWESGHPCGSRVNPFAVMQGEADRKLAAKIWERKNLPSERSFVFSLLVDVSGSMSGEPAIQAAECAVFLSEVLNRLKVPFEIATFSDSSRVIKRFEERPNKSAKDKIARRLDAGGGGTQDFDAVAARTADLKKRDEENKFLIVITDGGSSDGERLTQRLRDAYGSNICVIGLGIGEGTGDVDTYYPIGRGELSLDPNDREKHLGTYFAKTLEKILINPEQFVREALRSKERGGHDGPNNS